MQRVSKFRVRDFHTPDAVRLLRSIAAAHELSKQTLTHIKFVMSALLGYACLLGIIPNINPMDRVPIPASARDSGETYAYTLDEIKAMLMILPEPAAPRSPQRTCTRWTFPRR